MSFDFASSRAFSLHAAKSPVMRPARFTFLAYFAAASLALVACGDDDRVQRDGGGEDTTTDTRGCSEAGAITCDDGDVLVCDGSEYEFQETCEEPNVCATGIGCVACIPEAAYCQGRDVYMCNADGTGGTPLMACAPNEMCVSGVCSDACAVAASTRSNVGCDYFAVDLDNSYEGAIDPAAQEQFAVVLANPSDNPAQAMVFDSTGTVGSPAERLVENVVVPAQGLVRIDLPMREVDGSTASEEGPGTMLTRNAYRIRTNFPVVAYQFNPIIETASNDASLLIPVAALDNHYRVLGWPTANPIEPIGDMPGIPDHSYVTIVGTTANTTVNVTLGGDMVAGGIQGGGEIAGASAGETITFTLNAFDVLNLESDGIPGDMTGTLVESSAPVSVFSGGERGSAGGGDLPAHPSGVPEDWCCTDHLEEQVFPTSSWGERFVVTRSPVRTDHPTWREPDIYRMMADKNGTTVTTSLDAPFNSFTLSAGQWVEFHADRSFVVEANEAVSIQQILVSQGWVVSWKSGHGGDPSMLLFPPVEQYRDNYVFLVPDTFTADYVVVSAEVGTNIMLDGAPASCEVENSGMLDGTMYETHTCLVTDGVHRIDADADVGVMAYGYHSVGSYGYAAGSELQQINPLI